MNPRKEKFVEGMLRLQNATKAAKFAGYSERSAHVTGSRLLKDAEVCAALASAKSETATEAKVDVVTVLREQLRIGTSDIANAFATQADVDAKRAAHVGQLLHPVDMPEDFRRSIAGFEVEDLYEGSGEERTKVGTLHKFKLWPKSDALDKLGRHLGIYERDNKQAGETFANLVLQAQRARAGK